MYMCIRCLDYVWFWLDECHVRPPIGPIASLPFWFKYIRLHVAVNFQSHLAEWAAVEADELVFLSELTGVAEERMGVAGGATVEADGEHDAETHTWSFPEFRCLRNPCRGHQLRIKQNNNINPRSQIESYIFILVDLKWISNVKYQGNIGIFSQNIFVYNNINPQELRVGFFYCNFT